MVDLVYELDPKGEVFLILDNVSKDLPHNLQDIATLSGWPDGLSNPAAPTSDENESSKREDDGSSGGIVDSTKTPECTTQRRLQIRASSKHLTLSCPQFERTFQMGFQEGTQLRTKGHLKFPIRDWEPIPFLILMLIIHHRTRLVPREVSLDSLVEIARLVDYYECYEAVEPFSDSWLVQLKIRSLSPPTYYTPSSIDEAKKCMFVSWVFNEAKAFQESSKYLEARSTGMISFSGIPVPSMINDAINRSRQALIAKVVESMHDLFAKLRDGQEQCSEMCGCVLLGALTKGMHRSGILSLNSTSSLRGSASPNWRLTVATSKIRVQTTNIEKLNVGLDVSQYTKSLFPFHWDTRVFKPTVPLPS
ncbi:hypothetical protein ABOM_007917 [Aspergillus bombycis]|uniref:BTB domain-containing protein n=1 Tax=Aspergillus bombycis TaxID=109264 RepID=A0A1F7ZSH0_9EURO|nr:hypothetical protein ABOM_007917 [Aspergillus bombycis]OGM42367.1 hypothetical protein ABOM_007917 [Aspergillus bombycis]